MSTPKDITEAAKAATPENELRERIMNPSIAKSESEWWAARQIEKLEALKKYVHDEEVNWKGIVKGVHGALADLGNVPVPELGSDLYDTIMGLRLVQASAPAPSKVMDAYEIAHICDTFRIEEVGPNGKRQVIGMSERQKEITKMILHHVVTSGYLTPSGGLTVEAIVRIAAEELEPELRHDGTAAIKGLDKFRSRLHQAAGTPADTK